MSAVTDREMEFGWRSRGLADAVTDPFRPDQPDLDDRMRHVIGEIIRGAVGGIEADIRHHSNRSLAGHSASRAVEALLSPSHDMKRRLESAGVLHDPELVAELVARVRLDLLGEELPTAVVGPDGPSPLVCLMDTPDEAVAMAAKALLVADARRRDSLESGTAVGGDLPAGVLRRLVWWVAAAIGLDTDGETDRAVTEAALRVLAEHDNGDRAEVAASRLAEALDVRGAELRALVVTALGDRRIRLFTALLAHALRVDFDQVRDFVLDVRDDRLWLAMRALDLDRATMARVAVLLSEAEPARDLDAFARRLDELADLPVTKAREALRPLWWRYEYREAIRAVRGRR